LRVPEDQESARKLMAYVALVYCNRGDAWSRKGNLIQAHLDIKSALRFRPENNRYNFLLARLENEMKNRRLR
jgi:hypothetical protein